MSEDSTTIIQCSGCAQKMRIPTDRGALRATCPRCGLQCDWSPAPPASSAAAMDTPKTEATGAAATANATGTQRSHGLRTLLGFAAITLVSWELAIRMDTTGWLSFVLIGLTLLSLWVCYRGIRLLTGLNVAASSALAFVVFLLVSMAGTHVINHGGPVSMTLALAGGDLRSLSVSQDAGHFAAAHPDRTSPAELDELMEAW